MRNVLWIAAAVLLVGLTSAACASEPPPSSGGPAERQVIALDDQGAEPMALTIRDSGYLLNHAESASVEELAAAIPGLPAQRIAVFPIASGEGRVLLLWAGFGCDRTGTVTIAPDGTRIIVSPDPIENCDLVPSYRGLVLTFAHTNGAVVRAVLEPTQILGA